ncbi:uncharacterized protein BDZ99DRAFT_521873 [Mytilinidion resinicola]|uniref:BZIP domain-containing protein n=1 Tax=Mytilinidion resinicola TaxID=574789 RepID=A0A6A6YID7_9PEZI|nr:uncharacterized protein BDZ99DRAFT_521873 [Mytilinidion resinicola]KAF2808318.1 hypothetical protein BDZ99DRAFT_521873 [Mytilinidion resinicola]
MSEAPVASSGHLARIRDNQRRSRARRKEYLHELETKLRSCEQTGVEASAEIQDAARRVLEENKRLRALLRARGVSESEIVAVMGSHVQTPEHASAAPVLDSMLGQKRACSGQRSCGGVPCVPPGATSMPLPPTLSLSHQRSMSLDTGNASASPHSIGSSSIDTPTSISTPTFPHMPMATSQPEMPDESFQHVNYAYEIPSAQWTYPQETSYLPDQSLYNNTSSCVYAANIIRSMRSDVGVELEADLGCRELGADCAVDNSVVFSAIDKYADHSPGV